MPGHTMLTEQALHQLWLQRRIPADRLHTTDGETIEVINPGEYNRDSGPDFRRATLRIGGKIRHGDVEIHLQANDWLAHHHHCDPNYNDVILHIALAGLEAPKKLVKENQLTVPQMLLPHQANLLPTDGLSASAPAVAVSISSPLIDCPLSRTSATKIHATVRHAGLLRLAAKADTFAEQVMHSSWDQAVYRGIAEAMGYDKNQEPFRCLAELLPIELVFGELRTSRETPPALLLEALFFGAAGFLPSSPRPQEIPDAEIAAFLAPRITLWEPLQHTLQIRPLRREAWQFFRLRPANFPTRRLAGLSALLLKFFRNGLLEHLASLFLSAAKPKAIITELLNYFICPADDFWRTHYDFLVGGKSQRSTFMKKNTAKTGEPRLITAQTNYGDLIGRDRALDILVNIVLPALWHYGRQAGDAHFQNLVQEVYGGFPRLQENQITRDMRLQLSRQFPISRAVPTSAATQQGLIYLQKLYCRPLRCEACRELVRIGD
ncbi:MAG: DUF2851 family protein [candidate division KSB1 bacterium]|nr:DUF2851 family protein [candidate division KSB1 bacterium]